MDFLDQAIGFAFSRMDSMISLLLNQLKNAKGKFYSLLVPKSTHTFKANVFELNFQQTR